MTDEINHKISLPMEWALQKTLGPTLEAIGVDLEGLYSSTKVGVAKIALAAKRKIKDEPGLKTSANLRVTRDVFWNGAFSEEDICAEYFGGVLAGSRTQDGRDDTGIFYLDIIKSLSSAQLKLHYLIYSSLNKLVVIEADKDFNAGLDSYMNRKRLFIPCADILSKGIDYQIDLSALHSKGLLYAFEYEGVNDPDSETSLLWVAPTTLGVQLYAVAANSLAEWRAFGARVFGGFDIDMQLSEYGFDPGELAKKTENGEVGSGIG
jgi:hypothetical protein